MSELLSTYLMQIMQPTAQSKDALYRGSKSMILAMRLSLRAAWSIPLAVLLGCGSNPVPSAPAPTYLKLTGNWEAVGRPAPGSGQILTMPIADFTGALQSNNGNVTGTLRAFADPASLTLLGLNQCVSFTQDLPATGTISASGTLVLVVPIAGGVATITAQLSSDLEAFASGNWQIVGGACAMPSTTAAVTQFVPVTGTYVGTMTNLASATATVTAKLTQSSTPDADGRFPLTGTVTAQGACNATAPLGPEVVSGNGISPDGVSLTPIATIEGAFPPSAATILVGVEFYTGCSSSFLDGTLTRQ